MERFLKFFMCAWIYIQCIFLSDCSHTAAMLFGTAEFMSLGFQELPDGSAKAEKLANPKGMYVKQITQTMLFYVYWYMITDCFTFIFLFQLILLMLMNECHINTKVRV